MDILSSTVHKAKTVKEDASVDVVRERESCDTHHSGGRERYNHLSVYQNLIRMQSET